MREARAATGVPGVAAGLLRDGETVFAADGVLELGRSEQVQVETPFRIASITKPFTATLCAASVGLDDRLRALLSHTAGLRCESAELLPPAAAGLWSYSNAGYWQAGAACGAPFDSALAAHVLEPLGLAATGFAEPAAPARGHVQEGESGHRAMSEDRYPAARLASGGLWSTVGDLLRFAALPPRRRAGRVARAASARARCALRARLVGARARRRADDARPRRLRRGLPVAASTRARRARRASRADEQLARKRSRAARRRSARVAAASGTRSRGRRRHRRRRTSSTVPMRRSRRLRAALSSPKPRPIP